MRDIVATIILVGIAVACFVISYFQFNEKGFLFNNAYIFASKQERETMEKKLHYKQSGVVFLLIGTIFLIISVDMILQTGWLFYCIIMIAVVAIYKQIASNKKMCRYLEGRRKYFRLNLMSGKCRRL